METEGQLGKTHSSVILNMRLAFDAAPSEITTVRIPADAAGPPLIAGAAGLALAVLMLVFLAWSDRTVREARDLESFLRLPVAVTIPDLARVGIHDG